MKTAIEQMLFVLSAQGRASEADRLRQDFAARAWVVGPSDIQEVARVLANAPPAPVPTQPPAPPPVAAPPSRPLHPLPAYLEPHRPFIEALDDWPRLLAALEGVLDGATDWDRLQDAVHQLFVEEFGFDEVGVDHSSRLRGESAIEDFLEVGRFQGLSVCLVRLTWTLSTSRYSNTSSHYEPCFRVLPDALLVSLEPGAGALRVVYRTRAKGELRRPRYRCLVGPWFLRDPNETFLSLCRRFDLLRPRTADDRLRYNERAVAALEASVEALGREWMSAPVVPLEAASLPGLPLTQGLRSFAGDLEETAESWFGLGQVLRNSFPHPLVFGEAWIDVAKVEVVGEPVSVDEAWTGARSRERTLRLEMVLRSWEALRPMGAFEVLIALPVPDEQGLFWLEGQPYRHLLCLNEHGQLVPRPAGDETVEDDDEIENADEGDDSAGDGEDDALLGSAAAALDVGSDAATEPSEGQDSRGRDAEDAWGSSVETVLWRVAEVRLWFHLKMLRHWLRRRLRDLPLTPGLVRAGWLTSAMSGEPWPLVTTAKIRHRLEGVDRTDWAWRLIAARSNPGTWLPSPPSWACVSVSAGLQPGEWAAAACARAHPCGQVAVPQPSADGDVVLGVVDDDAFVAREAAGAIGQETSGWWRHSSMDRLGVAVSARVDDAARVAALGVVQPARVCELGPITLAYRNAGGVRARGDEVAALLRPELWPNCPVVSFAEDIPAPPSGNTQPELLVKEGAVLRTGAAWATVPTNCLTAAADATPTALLALDIVVDAAASRGLVLRIPLGVPSRVVGVGLREVIRAGVVVGWRAWLQVRALQWPAVAVLSEDGRLVPVSRTWRPHDLPDLRRLPDAWGAPGTGEAAGVLIGQRDDVDVLLAAPHTARESASEHGLAVEGSVVGFCGETGDPVVGRLRDAVVVVPEPLPLVTTGRVGLLDGLPRVLGRQEPWSWTRLRLLSGELGLAGTALEAQLREAEARWTHLAQASGPAGDRPDVPTGFWKHPRVTHLRSIRSQLSGRATGVRCACGSLQGARLLGAVCGACDEPVQSRSADAPLRRLKLPFAIVHPWALERASALLGLTDDELVELLTLHGPGDVVKALSLAASRPSAAALARVGLPKGHPRRLRASARRRMGAVIEAMLEELRLQPASAVVVEELLTRSVPLPDARAAGAGAVLGHLHPVASPLLRSLARLRGALKVYGGRAASSVPELLQEATIQVQLHAIQLFGRPGSSPTGSFSDLMEALNPWSRPDRPGLVAAQLRGAWGAPRETRSDWEVRSARAELVERWSVPLFGLLRGHPLLPAEDAHRLLGLLAEALADRGADLRPLLHMVSGATDGRATRLPRAPVAAEQRMRESLAGCVPAQLEIALAQAFAGWWVAPPRAEKPSGLRWLSPKDEPPELGRRVGFPLDHPAWADWLARAGLSSAPSLRGIHPDVLPPPLASLVQAVGLVRAVARAERSQPTVNRRDSATPTVEAAVRQDVVPAKSAVASGLLRGLQRDAPDGVDPQAEIRIFDGHPHHWLRR